MTIRHRVTLTSDARLQLQALTRAGTRAARQIEGTQVLAAVKIGVMVQQCLDRRLPEKATLAREIAAWARLRNADHTGIR